MLEQALTFNAPPHSAAAKPDVAYQSWRASMGKAVMRHSPDARTAGPMPSFGAMVQDNLLAAQAYAPAAQLNDPAALPDIEYAGEQEGGEYTFADIIDIINPLHHLPVIGTIYRKLSGDTIKPMANIIGGAVFGGPVGAVSSTMNVVIKSTTGKDIAENALAMVGIDATPSSNKPELRYETTAAFAPENNLVAANDIEITISAATNAYQTAGGRKNFAARNIATARWNA